LTLIKAGAVKKDEGEGQAKINKPSPFGDAKARDESEFVKREVNNHWKFSLITFILGWKESS